MKKLISVIALVLVLATLLSSCGVNFAKLDASEYVSLADGKLDQISVEVDRINLYPTEIRQAIYEALRGKAGENKDPLKNPDATFEKYDSFHFYHISFDQSGKLESTSLGVTYKNTDTVTGFDTAESITLGFGTNRDWLADLDDMLLNKDSVKYLRDHLFTTTPKTESEKPEVNPSSFLLLTYLVTDASNNTVKKVEINNPAILPGMLYAEGADLSDFKDGFEKDTYLDVIYQALVNLCNHTNESGEKNSVPKLAANVTITVKPTSEKPADYTDGVTDASAVTIYADVNFDTSNDEKDEEGNVTKETYESGTIRFVPRGMLSGENKTFFTLDNIVLYPKDDVKEDHDDKEGKEFDIIILPYAVTPYPEMKEYDNLDTEEKKTVIRDFIKSELTKANITPVGDDVDALKAQYEEYMYTAVDEKQAAEREKELEDFYKNYYGQTVDLDENTYFEQAEEDAKDAIWNKVLADVVASKLPEKSVRDYVKYREEELKYEYYYGSYDWYVPQGSIDKNGFKFTTSTPVTGVPASETGLFRNWKEYAVDLYRSMKGSDDKSLYTINSYADVKAILRKEGEAGVTGMLATYYVAGLLGITVDDARYAELIKEDAQKWIDSQKELYKNQTGLTIELTVEDYEEAAGGKDALRAQKVLELVKDELFKRVSARDGVTYKDIYKDNSAVEK